MDLESKELIELFSDPVKWAEAFLRNPRDKEEPLKLRSYQKVILENTRKYKNIILRYGRRMGKTVTVCADMLWWAGAYPLVSVIEGTSKRQKPIRIMTATPYENQISEIWKTFASLIADSPLLRQLVTKIRTSDIHTVEFDNGSIIEGYTIGITSSNKGTSLRSLSADIVFLDEMDFIPRDIMETIIMPIWTTHPETKLRVCSTPSGQRGLFWEWCTRAEELGWFHRHFQSWHPDNDNWRSIEQAKAMGLPVTESTEFQVKAITSSERFNREYGADFGEELGGVYKHSLLNKYSVQYCRSINIEDSDLFDPKFQYNPDNLYVMGVDWNSYRNGGQIVVLEYCKEPTIESFYDDMNKQDVIVDFTGKFRVFFRIGIKSKEATQRKTREEIIRICRQWRMDFIYVDYGHGDTNIEELTLFGTQHPELHLNQKLKAIDSGAVVEHWDPVLREKVSKRNKSLMINFSVLHLEEGRILLPKEEGTNTRLVGQMMNYKIKTVTNRGDYTYEGEDHILDAFNLALYGFSKEYDNGLFAQRGIYTMIKLADPRNNFYPQRENLNTNKKNPEYANVSVQYRDPEKPITKRDKPMRADPRGFTRKSTFTPKKNSMFDNGFNFNNREDF